MLTFSLEEQYHKQGYSVICGTDEAGRGPLAGPVFAAAVILPEQNPIEGLNDSKKCSAKKREALFEQITQTALAFSIQYADVEEIDRLNILNASQLAMNRAVDALRIKPDLVLVDGNIARGFATDTVTVIKGDAISPNIAAASILAKVARDRYCLQMDKDYPAYHFAAHKGYPTKEHMEIVRKIGPCPVHRKTFLKFLDR
ncbi:MAG: ribonuclease HII [Clostridiales bacterium]|nr:ribonuclease HII [Clostridiales bacterium]